MSPRHLLSGRPLSDSEASAERLGATSGVPALGLDALASAACGPEAVPVFLGRRARARPLAELTAEV